ncbi:FliA/WhiG family RNA polymerase sigma factor [Thermosulfurimonas marina]|uniref:FliA/WhiG family RNA polymerase sigma factor n=1 Tax=Thermosulfurimonas marina TaxID=2047767 RepID=A0A6H1WQT9_9BACT|nr:FliA/WhiG family RNA polymerase sigma factor [Thermosulfurimonas marina]QJA05520.1 FliA/WhiG family RNA polymerase sigma factor [Thermosulfurimonas marina]
MKYLSRSPEELIFEHLPLVKYLAQRLAGRLPPALDSEDLVSAGILGLIEAARRFDPSRKIQFKTFAEFRIRGAMLDELRQLDWTPRSVKEKAAHLEKVITRLEQRLGRPPEDEEVARELGLSLDDYYRLLDEVRGLSLVDLEALRKKLEDQEGLDLEDLLAAEDQEDPFEKLGLKELAEALAQAISELPERERLVITLYYYEGLTMKEIGRVMGYTESRISQIHSKALLHLRGKLRERLGESYREFLS